MRGDINEELTKLISKERERRAGQEKGEHVESVHHVRPLAGGHPSSGGGAEAEGGPGQGWQVAGESVQGQFQRGGAQRLGHALQQALPNRQVQQVPDIVLSCTSFLLQVFNLIFI